MTLQEISLRMLSHRQNVEILMRHKVKNGQVIRIFTQKKNSETFSGYWTPFFNEETFVVYRGQNSRGDVFRLEFQDGTQRIIRAHDWSSSQIFDVVFLRG